MKYKTNKQNKNWKIYKYVELKQYTLKNGSKKRLKGESEKKHDINENENTAYQNI